MNATGTALYVSQELLWKEQRITPKFSFHSTKSWTDVLGRRCRKFKKDYNGQTARSNILFSPTLKFQNG
jgi:hypothetical protein